MALGATNRTASALRVVRAMSFASCACKAPRHGHAAAGRVVVGDRRANAPDFPDDAAAVQSPDTQAPALIRKPSPVPQDLSHRHPLCPAHGQPVRDAAPRDGVQLPHDLLAAAGRLARPHHRMAPPVPPPPPRTLIFMKSFSPSVASSSATEPLIRYSVRGPVVSNDSNAANMRCPWQSSMNSLNT